MARGGWHMDADGEVLYEPRTCKLRRLDADAARRCLAGKTLAFIGGSLARYQYMNLAFFLSHRQHMQRYADDPAQRSLVIEKQWANFMHYYAAGSALLGWTDEAGRTAEHCHCHRLGTFGGSFEHRLLTVNFTTAASAKAAAVPGGPPPQASLRVVYNQTFGIKKNVAVDTAEALAWNLRGDHPADIVVLNLGHWANHNLKPQLTNYTDAAAAYEPIFAAARDARRSGNKRTRFVWRTTTHARKPTVVGPDSFSNWNPLWHRMLTGLARFHKWEVYDGHAVSRAMLRAGLDGHWDNLHFLPFVYDQLNDVLLNGVC
jgi:hypothetical protein